MKKELENLIKDYENQGYTVHVGRNTVRFELGSYYEEHDKDALSLMDSYCCD